MKRSAGTPGESRKPAKKLITIRLQKALLADLKKLAKVRGKRYQTLINDVLAAEIKEYENFNPGAWANDQAG